MHLFLAVITADDFPTELLGKFAVIFVHSQQQFLIPFEQV
jgi:hypothetical protein